MLLRLTETFPEGKCLLRQRSYAYIGFARGLFGEFHRTCRQSEQSMVFAHAYVFTRIVDRTSLTNDDVARLSVLTAEKFYAESLAFGLTAVLRTTYTFFVCHLFSVFKLSNDFFDEYLGEILTMPVQNLIPFSSSLLEHQNLIVFQVFENLGVYRDPFYNRCAYLDLTVVIR